MNKKIYHSHICTIESKEDDFHFHLPENANWYHKIKLRFWACIVLSERNPRSRYYFRSHYARLKEIIRHTELKHPFVIHPLSPFRMIWEMIMFNIFLISLIAIPLQIVKYVLSLHHFHIGTWMLIIIDLFCLTDIIFSFVTGHIVEETHQIVLHLKPIFRRYGLSVFFPMDLISSIPMDLVQYFYEYFTGHSNVAFIQAVALIKIVRIRTLLAYLEHSLLIINVKPVWRMVSRYIIISFIVMHWDACIDFSLQKYYMLQTGKYVQYAWIVRRHIYNETSVFKVYIKSMFRSMSTFAGIRHQLISIRKNYEAIWVSFYGLFGYIFYGMCLIIFTDLIISNQSHHIKYDAYIDQLNQYMKHKQMPIELQNRLIQYFNYRYHGNYFREAAVTGTLPLRMMDDINLFCSRKLIETSILKDLQPKTRKEIIAHLKEEVFLPNDIIIKSGTTGTCMYFIYKGTACVLTSNGKEICHVQDGEHFGEVALMTKTFKRMIDVVAIEICTVFRLNYYAFYSKNRKQSEFLEMLEGPALKRSVIAREIEEIHQREIMERLYKQNQKGKNF